MKFLANSRRSSCQTSVNDSTSSLLNHSRYRISPFSLPDLTVLVTESHRSRYRISPFSLLNHTVLVTESHRSRHRISPFNEKDLNTFKCLFVILYLFFFSDFCVLSVNASPHRPAPIPYTYNLPCKVLVATRVELRTFFPYKYVAGDLIKIIFVVFLWVLIMSTYRTLNVRYVNFCWNLSMLPRNHETSFVFNHTVKSRGLYLYVFVSL